MPEDKIELNDQITDEQRGFIATDKEKEVVQATFHQFREAKDHRNMNYEYFDGINLVDYIDDSVRRFTTNIDEREDLEDWQARIHDQITRTKVLAIWGKTSAVLPIAQITGRGDEDIRKGTILTNLYEYAEELDDYDELMSNILLEAIVKGTAIGYEGVEKKTYKRRNIKGEGDDITITEGSETVTKLFGVLVPLEEFYPSNVGIRTIKNMPYCFWRTVIPYSNFLAEWGSFKKSSLVQPRMNKGEDEERQFFEDYISDDVQEGNVEVIRRYDKENDQYIIVANGIWLNSLIIKDKTEQISPLPFNHKELPFWDIKYDYFGDFFYGKSLPDRLKSMQDVLNVLTNMLLDQSFLTIFPPMLTAGVDDIEDDYLRPGRRTPVSTDGLPLNQSFMKLDLGAPSGWHQFILEYTRDVIGESSIDKVSAGTAGVGERTTAEEIRRAAEGVAATLGPFSRQVNSGIKRKCMLKTANIMQFWTDPKSPMINRVNGETGRAEFNKVFNVFKIDNAVLSGGKRGSKVIELYSNSKDMPTGKQLKARSIAAKAVSKQDIEFIALEPEYIRSFLFDVKLIANPRSEVSQEVEKALQLEKVRVYMSFFPQIVNVKELAAETAEKMGDDPTKILTDDIFQTVADPGREVDKGISTTPTENTANNIARSVGGGQL